MLQSKLPQKGLFSGVLQALLRGILGIKNMAHVWSRVEAVVYGVWGLARGLKFSVGSCRRLPIRSHHNTTKA